jgi:hypothetical protein
MKEEQSRFVLERQPSPLDSEATERQTYQVSVQKLD